MLNKQAPSPFIPGTTIQWAWDQTSISWMQECWRKYYYAMVLGYRSKHESIHLFYGILYHSALERFDRYKIAGVNFDDAQRAIVRFVLNETWIEGKPWESDHDKKTRETLVRSVIWYTEQFKNDPAETVRLANGEAAVELTFQMPLDWGPYRDYNYVLTGHMDRLVSLAGDLYCSDRKTTGSALGARYYETFKPNVQVTQYTLAGKVVYKMPIKGVLIDAAQILTGSTNFGRTISYRTDKELEEYLNELKHYWFPLQIQQARESIDAPWPMNPQACHKYEGCQFRKVCSMDPALRQRALDSDFIKHPWNPLEQR